MRVETCYHNYLFQLAARGLLYAPPHRPHYGICYNSRGALARNPTVLVTVKVCENGTNHGTSGYPTAFVLNVVFFNKALNTVAQPTIAGLLHPMSYQGVKEMFCLMMHSLYFIYCYIASGRKEGNVLFNDALNTFYLRLYGFRHMVKDHSDSERGNLLPPHGLLFPISSRGSVICTIPQTG